MDLSLQTGWPLSFIARLPERELVLWAKYASEKGFPMRRHEYGLALIAKLIAQTMGGAERVTLRDFLFDPEEEPHEMTAEELGELKADIGFNPTNG